MRLLSDSTTMIALQRHLTTLVLKEMTETFSLEQWRHICGLPRLQLLKVHAHRNSRPGGAAEITADITQLRDLRCLSIKSGYDTEQGPGMPIPTELLQLSHLTKLVLAGVQADCLLQLRHLSSLHTLGLHTSVSPVVVPSNLAALTSLQALRLHDLELSGSVLALSALASLQDLSCVAVFHDHSDQGFCQSLRHLTTLTLLRMDSCGTLGVTSDDLHDLAKLEKLVLTDMNLTMFTASPLWLNLREIDIALNELTAMLDLSALSSTALTCMDVSHQHKTFQVRAPLTVLDQLPNLNCIDLQRGVCISKNPANEWSPQSIVHIAHALQRYKDRKLEIQLCL